MSTHFTETSPDRKAAKPLSSDWQRVSPTYSLRFTFVDGAFEVHYSPHWPPRPELEPLLPSYRTALRRFFGELFARGVRRIGCFELRGVGPR